jgi:diguanylate cyclase
MTPIVASAAAQAGHAAVAPGAAANARAGAVNRHPGRYFIIVLTAIVGAFASFGMYLAIGGWQAHVAELRFTSLARDHLQTINSGLQDATDLLYSMRAYFESLDRRPSRAEYLAFSASLRRRVVGLRDTGWAPRVTAAERDSFEHDIRATGLPDFQIVERNTDGKLVRAGDRAEYFPILYSDPSEINRPILGFDLASENMRNRVLQRARASDRPAATPPLKLVNIQRPNGGVMSFVTIDGRDAAPGDGSRSTVGVVLGAFETAAMIENILAVKVSLVGLDMYVFDPAAPAGNRMVYWHSADSKPAPSEAAILATRHWQGTLELVDQRWDAVFVPSQPFEAGDWSWVALAVLAGGLILTASIVGYLWFSLRHTQQLERLTASLHATTEELRQNGAKLDHMARHDVLTGLPNRVAFREAVADGLRRVRRGQGLAVLYLDLDRFKAVNDTLGHPVGDRLLCEVADRLRDTVRDVDSITRLGGDEFAIAQFGVAQRDDAETLAHRVIETLSRPYDIGGQQVVVGVSVGITLAGREDQDADQLLRRADLALYVAKREGRGIWRSFDVAMDHDAQVWRGLEMDLRQALEQSHLELYYQPQISIRDGAIRGFEALLRWHRPGRGIVLPGDFLQCAEETGLIIPIGAWVLRTALAEAARWPAELRVAVNLSSYQLVRDDLVGTIEAALAASGQTGSRLELEVTENALLRQHAAGQETLKRIRALGVRIAMDDFGTGYSSLSHLRSFPYDRIKIDQSFVAGMTESHQGGVIVRAILQLAAGLDIATTAEGVETPAQLELLAANGCREAQGFLFSPPRPAAEVLRMLSDWRPMLRDQSIIAGQGLRTMSFDVVAVQPGTPESHQLTGS